MANPFTNYLKHLYHNTAWGHALLQKGINFYNFFLTRFLPEETYIKRRFKAKLGYNINLKSPQTLNEKLNWLKLHDRKPLYTQCADKYAVRSYIKEKIGEEYLVPLFFMTKNPKDITKEKLPDTPCIIKTNNDSGGVHIVRDKNKVDYIHIQQSLKKGLKRKYFYQSKEWQYKNIKPCIVVEKLLMEKDGSIPADYKFHCFNGKVKIIQVDLDRQIEHKRNLYDTDWNLLNFEWIYKNGHSVNKPLELNKLIELAEIIAVDFTFVRVDFYYVNDKIYFGEITFHPESGNGIFRPKEWDLKLGQLLTLPHSQKA